MAATPQTIVQNWVNAMQSATVQSKYRAAIQNVQTNPMEAAAAAVQSGKYLAGIQRSISEGKMIKKLGQASFANWKQITSTTGAANLTSGATKGTSKMTAAANTIAQAGQAAKAAAAAQNSPLAKVQAAIQAIQSAWGYTPTV